MKRAVSISLGSSARDKSVVVNFKGQPVSIERIGTDGDATRLTRLCRELDGKVDALAIGGADLYYRLRGHEYPARAVLKLINGVHQTPVVDGRGLKHNTLERRVFELAKPQIGELPRFRRAFVPVALDRQGLARAVEEVTDEVLYGDLLVALSIPIVVRGFERYCKVARALLPFVTYLPLSLIYYGSDGKPPEPKYERYWEMCDLIAGDFMFMRKCMPLDMSGKTVITNTTTDENIELLKERGVRMVITTTPRYEGRSFGTNMMEAALTAYSGKGRQLTDEELNALIDELDIRPTVRVLND